MMPAMRLPGLAFASVFLAGSAAHAGGLFIPGTGPSAQGRAGAFVARADDPSAIYHNPAGLAKTEGTVVMIGSNFVDYDVTFQREGSYEQPTGEDLPYAGQPYPEVSDESSPALGIGSFQAIPLIAVATDFGRKDLPIRAAIGLYAPNAYPERDFVPGYQFEEPGVAPPPQRYDVVNQKAATAFPSIAVAYRPIPQLDIGARFSWGFAEVEATSYTWGVRNYEEWVARDGIFHIEASDPFVPAWGFGVLYRAADMLELGASYHSSATIEAKGFGTAVIGSDLGVGNEQEFIEPENEFVGCEAGGTLERLKACITVPLPQVATVGARWILRDAVAREVADIELNVRWENWSNASTYDVVVDGKSGLTGLPLQPSVIRHGFDDVISVRLGGSYTMPLGVHQVIFRAGGAHDTATAPDSWQRLDVDGAARTTLALGAAYKSDRFRVDFAGGMVLEPDRTVESCNPTTAMPGCENPADDTAFADRTSPDPVQPLATQSQQVQSPFNGGTYSSGYLLASLGLTLWF
jgi:long-subunit fatty acid transport protein